MKLKVYNENKNVLEAANERIKYVFNNFEKIILSFSGGKDSTVMFHLVMEEAKKRNKKICIMLIDFEAQYRATIQHAEEMFNKYHDYIDLHWICLPIKLRNASSNYEPTWTCWDAARKNDWVRDLPKYKGVINDNSFYPFFQPKMEFEEFVPLFAEWYSDGIPTAVFVGIRADESLNRFRTISLCDKVMHGNNRWTTEVVKGVFNIYPIYDWKTKDIWTYHGRYPDKCHNHIYDLMHQAGVKPSQQRLCQPYGDDQRRGLWLYHILEPETWYKVVARVNGVNSGSLYINERGNINGYNKITKPDGHTYKSFCNLLLSTLPDVSREHFVDLFKRHIKGWKTRGYIDNIPDEAPLLLENKYWVPSWRRLCKVLLRNDWWGKGLGMQQPKSEAYGKYLELKKSKKEK